MASLAALHDARAALEECLSALESVESELEGEAVAGGEAGEVTTLRKRERERERESEFGEGRRRRFCSPPLSGKKLKQLRSALRSAVAEAAATVVALEDETGEWEERDADREERGIPPPPSLGARVAPRLCSARRPAPAARAVPRPKEGEEEKKGRHGRRGRRRRIADNRRSYYHSRLHQPRRLRRPDLGAAAGGVRDSELERAEGLAGAAARGQGRVPRLRFEAGLFFFRSSCWRAPPPPSDPRRGLRLQPRLLPSGLLWLLLPRAGGRGRRRRRCCWRSVGLDVSPVAIADARGILDCNPHLQPLIELRQGPEEGLVDAERVGILRHGFAKRGGTGEGDQSAAKETTTSSAATSGSPARFLLDPARLAAVTEDGVRILAHC